jgi:RNA polymerase sigma-70 factor, ECF subfamily
VRPNYRGTRAVRIPEAIVGVLGPLFLTSTTLSWRLSNSQTPNYHRLRMAAADEQHLISQAKQGSHEAYRILVERHMKQAYNVAFGFVNDHASAEDVAQEAFVRAFQSLPSFRGESEFSTWLYRIVTNLSLNSVKRRKALTAREVPIPHEDLLPPGAEDQTQPDVRAHIEKALHELPTLQRAVVILRHVDGLSTKQVSAILQCSEGTVKTHLFRGLRKLREKLKFLKTETAL